MRVASSSNARSYVSSSGAPACQRYVPPPSRSGSRMLHERDSLPLHRLRHERLRPVVALPEGGERLAQSRVVVPVARAGLPSESDQLRLQVAERDDLVRRLVGLELVAVDDHPQPAQPLVGCALEPLPVLAFLQLAVARHHDDAAAVAEMPLRPGDPAALRDPHAERARVRLDSRDPDVRMSVEPAEPAKPQQTLAWDDAERDEGRILPRHVVPLRGEEDVAVGIVEADLAHVQLLEEQVRDDVERAEARPEVTRPGPLHGDERVQPAHVGEHSESRVAVRACGTHPIEVTRRDDAEVRHGDEASQSTSSTTWANASCPCRSTSVRRDPFAPTFAPAA